MPPRPPSKAAIKKSCRAIAQELFYGPERDDLTVKLVRKRVEKGLGLEDGFLKGDEWRSFCRAVVEGCVDELMGHGSVKVEGQKKGGKEGRKEEEEEKDVEEEEEVVTRLKPVTKKPKEAETARKTTQKELKKDIGQKEEEDEDDYEEEVVNMKVKAPVKQGTKRPSAEKAAGPAKRRKKESESELSDLEMDSSPAVKANDDESDFDVKSDSDAPKKKRAVKAKMKAKPPVKRQTKKARKVESEDEAEDVSEGSAGRAKSEESDHKSPLTKLKKEPARKSLSKSKAESESECDDQMSHPKEEEQPRNLKAETIKKSEDSDTDTKDIPTQDSDSEMSIVLDEAPKPKRKRASPSNKARKSTTTTSSSKTAKDASPLEQQLKTLQSQLVKCGVRKIWAFELKQYNDDTKAKIRHLQKMLTGVGMTGRFSNERARQIKEMRELRADVEAVREGEMLWGVKEDRQGKGGVKRESLKEEDDSEEDSEGSEVGMKRSRSVSEKPEKAIKRVASARAKADLAFLGDESDSD